MDGGFLGNIYGDYSSGYAGGMFDRRKAAPTIRTCQGGNQQPLVVEMESVKSRKSCGKRHKIKKAGMPTDSYTLAYEDGEYVYFVKVRKLTPRECWRLMGFADADFDKAVGSNTQLYKQAGNSIVKDCLVAIIGNIRFDRPVRLIELFAGIGSQAMAFKELGIGFEHYRMVEFDRHPVDSYNAIHGTDFTPSDITELEGSDLGVEDADKHTYFLTYSFPCQDLSIAGKHKGMAKESGTRSGLLWEVERLLDETEELPQYLLMENVTHIHSKRNMKDFREWLDFLSGKGYRSFWHDMNAVDYGVAQSRERCFCVSMLEGEDYEFPVPNPTKRVLGDYLEGRVEEKYYLKAEKVENLMDQLMESGRLIDRKPVRKRKKLRLLDRKRNLH